MYLTQTHISRPRLSLNYQNQTRTFQVQTPIDDSGILPRYREALKLPPSPCWSPSQGIPHKGQAPGRVTSWIALSLPHAQMGLRCVFRQASTGPLSAVFTIKLSAEPPRALFPLVHGGGYTTNAVGVISQDYKPPDVQQLCAQTPSDKRYANLTKH